MSQAGAISEWQRARAALGAAGSCRRDGYYADAISRAYYAVLHAARAALELYGFPTKTHTATNNTFGLRMVRTGRVESPFGSMITDLSDARLKADYEVGLTFTVADADAAYMQAEAFLDRIQAVLAAAVPAEQLR